MPSVQTSIHTRAHVSRRFVARPTVPLVSFANCPRVILSGSCVVYDFIQYNKFIKKFIIKLRTYAFVCTHTRAPVYITFLVYAILRVLSTNYHHYRNCLYLGFIVITRPTWKALCPGKFAVPVKRVIFENRRFFSRRTWSGGGASNPPGD